MKTTATFWVIILSLFNVAPLFADLTKFVVLILSYNNERFVEKNISSALDQKYPNYRIVYVNDCSSDNTLEVLTRTIENHPKKNQITVIDNKERKKGVRNFYEVIHNFISDDEVVCCLDGDDWFSSDHVLEYLSKVYENPKKELWITFGNYIGSKTKSGQLLNFKDYPHIENRFRKTNIVPSHLKTFYAWLFKKIKKEDLFYEGRFMEMTSDLAIMYPMLEMAQNHYFFIKKVLYIYNEENSISVHRIDRSFQKNIGDYLRKQEPYKALD